MVTYYKFSSAIQKYCHRINLDSLADLFCAASSSFRLRPVTRNCCLRALEGSKVKGRGQQAGTRVQQPETRVQYLPNKKKLPLQGAFINEIEY